MKKNKNTKAAKALALTSIGLPTAVGFAVAAPLILNAQSHASSSSSPRINESLTTVGGIEVGIESQKTNVAPKYLYSLPVLDSSIFSSAGGSSQTNKLNNFLANSFRAMDAFKLSDQQEVYKKYSDALTAVFAYTAAQQNNVENLPAIAAA